MKSKARTFSEIELRETIPEFPITPGPSETITIAKEPEHTRNYSQRRMQPGSVLGRSVTTQRRLKQKASVVIQQVFN